MSEKKYLYVFVPCAAAVVFFAVISSTGAIRLRTSALGAAFYYLAVAPLFEEFIFRGTVQRFLSEKTSARLGIFTLANVIASFVFAFCHLWSRSPAEAALTALPSLVFGAVYDKTGSVLACAAVHGVFNVNVFIVYQSDILGKIL